MIYINLDISPIIELVKDFKPAVDRAMADAARDLSVQTHAHILEQVQSKLHSTRKKYVDALKIEQVDADTWVIQLDRNAMWIEEGIKPDTDMLEYLLKSPKAKTAKDGSKYLVVPFDHKKGQTQQTQAGMDLTSTIRKEMKKRNIPYGNIETGHDGKPKTGLLHSFDIMKNPIKTGSGPGMGHGPLGKVRQGPTGIPFLQGVRVYQTPIKGKDGKSSIQKSIMTFRVASSKHKGQGRWVHPGLEAKRFLDEAARWALKEFEERIRDQILISVTKSF